MNDEGFIYAEGRDGELVLLPIDHEERVQRVYYLLIEAVLAGDRTEVAEASTSARSVIQQLIDDESMTRSYRWELWRDAVGRASVRMVCDATPYEFTLFARALPGLSQYTRRHLRPAAERRSIRGSLHPDMKE